MALKSFFRVSLDPPLEPTPHPIPAQRVVAAGNALLIKALFALFPPAELCSLTEPHAFCPTAPFSLFFPLLTIFFLLRFLSRPPFSSCDFSLNDLFPPSFSLLTIFFVLRFLCHTFSAACRLAPSVYPQNLGDVTHTK